MSQETETDGLSSRSQETIPAGSTPRNNKKAEAGVAEEWQVGDVILDLYEVKELLGAGGMGRVYRVHHKNWNIDLAVKTPRPEIISKVGGKENFVNEAETWVNLGLHPHTVSCYYVRDLGGIPRVFAECVEGGSLSDWIRTRKLYEGGKDEALKRILDVAIQFAWGLHYAHEQGLVHQDVKPANVMMTFDGVAKVTDFGLAQARALAGEAGQESVPGKSVVVAGVGLMTPAYASPEQSTGSPLTRKTDTWSWAASMLEMFAGELFWISGTAVDESLDSYLEEWSEGEGLPGMPAEIVELLRSCFKQTPDERPRDMLEISNLLQGVYRQASGEVYPRQEPKAATRLADTLNNRAASLLDLGKSDEAERLWEEALGVQAHHPESTYNRGLLLWRAAKIDDLQLVSQMRQAQDTSGAGWRASFLLSLIHLERDDAEAAIKILDKIEKRTPATEVRSAWAVAVLQLPNSKRLLRTFPGHHDRVNSVVIGRDGHHILSGSDDQTMKLWDMKSGRCLHSFEAGEGEVTSVALSGDSQYALALHGSPFIPLNRDWWGVAQFNDHHTMKLWDTRTGACLRTFAGLTNEVNSAALSSDGRYILAGGHVVSANHSDQSVPDEQNLWDRLKKWFHRSRSEDITMSLWDVKGGRGVRAFRGHWSQISSVCLDHDGRYALSVGLEGTIKLWDVETGRCLRTFEGKMGEVTSVTLSDDSRFALSGRQDGTIKLLEAATGRLLRTFEGHSERVMSVSLSQNARYALSGGWEGSVKLWDVETGRCLRTFEGRPQEVTSVTLSRDGQYGLSGGDDLKLWKVSGTAYVAPIVLSEITKSETALQIETAYENSVALARAAFRDDDLVAALKHIKDARSYSGYERSAEAVEMWTSLYRRLPRKTLNEAWEKATFPGDQDGIASVSLSGDGLHALSGGNDKTLKLWELETGRCLRTFEGHEREVGSVSFSHDNRYAVSGADDSTMKLWDVATGRCLKTFEGHNGFVRSTCLSEDGQFLLSGDFQGSTLRLWDVKTGRCLRTFEVETGDWSKPFASHSGRVASANLSKDGRYALSGSDDKTMKLWDVETGNCIRVFEGHNGSVNSVCISHDGQYALSGGGDKMLKLWDVETGRCLRTFEGHTDWVESIGLSRDGRHVVSGSRDQTVRLWDVETGICLRILEGHADVVTSVSLAHDMRYALSGSNDKTMKLWVLDWELEDREKLEWNEGARHYLKEFLAAQTPYAGTLPNDREPSSEEITLALIRQGTPAWTEQDFQQLLDDLGCGGFGWLQPEGVRRELERMASDYSRPVRNFNEIELQRRHVELRNSLFEFCTRCGARVEPYRSNEFVDHDEASNYDQRLPYPNRDEEAYWCEKCGTWWRAFGAGDTGQSLSCGHFMPFYVSICAFCGPKTSGNQGNLDLMQIQYRCADCGQAFPIQITKTEYNTSLDSKHDERCGRCGQVVGKGKVKCRKCDTSFTLVHGHAHVGCDVASGTCPNCDEKYVSLCIC